MSFSSRKKGRPRVAVTGVGAINPPTITDEYLDPERDHDYNPDHPRNLPVQAALSTSSGLGGQNACLILTRYDHTRAGPGLDHRPESYIDRNESHEY